MTPLKMAKEFDCVQMKVEILERLLREVAEFGEEEARKRRKERMLRDLVLGKFLRAKMAIHRGTMEQTPEV